MSPLDAHEVLPGPIRWGATIEGGADGVTVTPARSRNEDVVGALALRGLPSREGGPNLDEAEDPAGLCEASATAGGRFSAPRVHGLLEPQD